MICFCSLTVDEHPSDLRQSKTPFWVQIYDFPFNQHTLIVVKSFSDNLGGFIEWDDSQLGRWWKPFGIRAFVDLTKPLKRGTWIKDALGNTTKVFFFYMKGSMTFVIRVWEL